MNERIRELIDQATIRGVEYLAGNDGHPTPTIYFDKEKFAELIIKECLSLNKKVCNDLKDADQGLNGYKTMMNLYKFSLSNAIEEHFGVE